jgi:(R)-2-hydroxyacyl-CoA dehydratese activating ATPase
MIIIGMDIGSAAIKVAFIDGHNLIWSKGVPTIPQPVRICETLLQEGLEELSIERENVAGVVTTGYGKRLFPDSTMTLNEISANAAGAHFLSNGAARTVINIGGQDLKVIKISSEGKVEDFKMNDKCAAGTGRFFEMAARILDTPVEDFGDLSTQSTSPVSINSTCTVFAESEIVSLLAMGKDRNDIIGGIHRSLSKRISELVESIGLEDDIYLDGGPGNNRGLLLSLQDELLNDINIFEKPQFTVAFGAAILLSENL